MDVLINNRIIDALDSIFILFDTIHDVLVVTIHNIIIDTNVNKYILSTECIHSSMNKFIKYQTKFLGYTNKLGFVYNIYDKDIIHLIQKIINILELICLNIVDTIDYFTTRLKIDEITSESEMNSTNFDQNDQYNNFNDSIELILKLIRTIGRRRMILSCYFEP